MSTAEATQDDIPGYASETAAMLCGGCAFWKKGCRNDEAKCCPEQRADRRLIIFKLKEPKQ